MSQRINYSKKAFSDSKLVKRIGVFGGLFDPPHIGHLIIAQWVLDEFSLDKIIFIPAFNPPHKKRYSPFKNRYEMTRLAIKENKNFLISDIEKNVKGKTYTVEVIKALKKDSMCISKCARKNKILLYLIIGADQWQEIRHWKDPEDIFKECKVIVLPRPGYKIKKIKPFYKKILVSNAPLIDISSTMIRNRFAKGLDIRYFVSELVYNYIHINNLYRKA